MSVSLGRVLVDIGVITEEQLAEAWISAGRSEAHLAAALIDLGYATEAQIIRGIGVKHRAPYFENLDEMISPAAAALVSEKLSRQYLFAPLFQDGDALMVAMLNPFDIQTLDLIERETGMQVRPVVSTRKAIFAAISKLYHKGRKDSLQATITEDAAAAGELFARTGTEEKRAPEAGTDGMTAAERERLEGSDAPVVRLVNKILSDAIAARATDIHVEPSSLELVVRYRIDGILRRVATLPAPIAPAVVSRIKIMARLDIAESRQPQDGHIQFGDRSIDLRVSTIPTVTGEKTVIRILNKAVLKLDFESLGCPPPLAERLRTIARNPNGILLVTGPTGSGKTTTLYTLLLEMRSDAVNIATLEDPVEYQFDGISQIQVSPRTGLTFAKGLRALLRQDPDVILVGEIRDLETAGIAIHAALTGHFILSTLHTNDAVGTIQRLLNMDVDPYLVTASVRGILAQRLARALCAGCREAFAPDSDLLDPLGFSAENRPEILFRARGCGACEGTGYQGRTAIYELLEPSPEVNALICSRAPHEEIFAAARAQGFRTMMDMARERLVEGVTSPDEVFRVIRSA
jgi:type IV pilus assembly protein PilB